MVEGGTDGTELCGYPASCTNHDGSERCLLPASPPKGICVRGIEGKFVSEAYATGSR